MISDVKKMIRQRYRTRQTGQKDGPQSGKLALGLDQAEGKAHAKP